MPLSMPSQVLRPAASSSPTWVQHLVNFGGTLWIEHPVTAAAAAVWIQVGIGLLLVVAPFGRWSRFAGASSAAWGLVVWGFGEAFGGIFAPGATWLFGAPGAVLFYVVAGVLIALPSRVWSTPDLGSSGCSGPWGCSSWAWRSSRPGRAGASGKGRAIPTRPPGR